MPARLEEERLALELVSRVRRDDETRAEQTGDVCSEDAEVFRIVKVINAASVAEEACEG